MGKSVIGALGNEKLGSAPVLVTQIAKPKTLPVNKSAWREFAVKNLKKAIKFSVVSDSLNSSPRVAYSAELSWSVDDLAMKSRVAFLVTEKTLIVISYDDDQASYNEHNGVFKELFDDLAQGKEEEIVKRAIKSTIAASALKSGI